MKGVECRWRQAVWFHGWQVHNLGELYSPYRGQKKKEVVFAEGERTEIRHRGFGECRNIPCLDLGAVYRVCLLR